MLSNSIELYFNLPRIMNQISTIITVSVIFYVKVTIMLDILYFKLPAEIVLVLTYIICLNIPPDVCHNATTNKVKYDKIQKNRPF